MNSKQKTTLNRVFQDPVRPDILWSDIERLLLALGAEISAGQGSRVRIYLNGVRAIFHRPHPERVAGKGAVKSVRGFLLEAGVEASGGKK